MIINTKPVLFTG